MKLFKLREASDDIKWMTRPRRIGKVTYNESFRRWGWSVISEEGEKKPTWWRRFWLQFIAKFLHIMFRMENLAGGPG